MRDYLGELLLSSPKYRSFIMFRPAAAAAKEQRKQLVPRSKSQIGEFEEQKFEKRSVRADSSSDDDFSDTSSLISKKRGERMRIHTKSMIEVGGRGDRYERGFNDVP